MLFKVRWFFGKIINSFYGSYSNFYTTFIYTAKEHYCPEVSEFAVKYTVTVQNYGSLASQMCVKIRKKNNP